MKKSAQENCHTGQLVALQTEATIGFQIKSQLVEPDRWMQNKIVQFHAPTDNNDDELAARMTKLITEYLQKCGGTCH